MGSGKSSWACQYVLSNVDKNFLYITPFLKEISDFVDDTNKLDRKFKTPINNGSGKLESLNNLISNEDDIAATHALFRQVDKETLLLLHEHKYILILDEVLDVIEPFPIKPSDIKLLTDGDYINIDDFGVVHWKEEKSDYDGKHNDVKNLAENKCLVRVNGCFYIWKYPSEIFSLFDEVYVLTYLFNGSILKAYFDLNRLQYTTKSVKEITLRKYELCEYYKPNTSTYKDLIEIYEGPENHNVSKSDYALSVSWFKNSKNKERVHQLKNNLENIYRRKWQAKAESVLWTTFDNEKFKGKARLKGKGYTNGFIACNSRCTDDYQDTCYLAYCANIYVNPYLLDYFEDHKVDVGRDFEELYATAQILQWIFRSRIRKPVKEKIWIYVPSKRMRRLLNEWVGR